MGKKDRGSKSRPSRESKKSIRHRSTIKDEHKKRKSTKSSNKRKTKHSAGESSSQQHIFDLCHAPCSHTDTTCHVSPTCTPNEKRKKDDYGTRPALMASDDNGVACFEALDKLVLKTDLDLGDADGVEYEYDPFAEGDPDVAKSRRTRIVLGKGGEPELVSDESDDDDICPCTCELEKADCHRRIVKVYVTPPVLIPKKEYMYHVNVVGESDVLEICRLDEFHPLPNCTLRDRQLDKENRFYPDDYVQGVCSEMLDTNLTGPRWLGEEFDKTEEQREAERIQRERDEAVDNMEYEF